MASRRNYIQFIHRSVSTYSRYHLTKSSPLPISSQLINPCLNLGSRSSPVVVSRRLSNPNCMLTYRFFSNKPVESVSKVEEKAGESSEKSNVNAGKYFRSAPVTWLSFFFLAATGGGLVYYYNKEKKRHIEEITTSVKQGPSVGKAAIGGPFKLVNHEGKTITEKDFCGKWTLLYFGFTHCPDICPDELIKLAAAIDKIQKAGIEVVPVFITVDPERDTVEQVRDYVQEFHPKLVGLTGSSEEIKKVARAYRVYYMKTEEEGSDYLVDHSIVMYLMDPNMEFVKFFGKNNDVDALTVGIINEIKQYKK